MATKDEVLQELEALGTAQNRKTYGRHGVGGDMYGVSYADLGKVRKRIKINQTLAEELWASDNHDARILATMIADPKAMNEELIETWAGDLSNYIEADAFVGLVNKTPYVRAFMERWIDADDECLGRAAWHLLANLALDDKRLDDAYFMPFLGIIQREIHASKNRIRQAMNNALIAIGARSDALEEQALAAAARIGKVYIDHGDTNCKTPDAASYILKTRAHQAAKLARAA